MKRGFDHDMSTDEEFADRLNGLLRAEGLSELRTEACRRFQAYLSVLLRWNARVNLTAIRSEDGILSRHFLESIQCARLIPAGVMSLLDFGSGGGFPGIPIAICRPEIAVTLAESQGRKAAFLREALRAADVRANVHAARAETLADPFDCVTMRAVDDMENAVKAAAVLVSRGGWLVLMSTDGDVPKFVAAAGPGFDWQPQIHLPGSAQRVIAMGCRAA